MQVRPLCNNFHKPHTPSDDLIWITSNDTKQQLNYAVLLQYSNILHERIHSTAAEFSATNNPELQPAPQILTEPRRNPELL